MEQEWQNDAGALTAQAIPQKDVEQACFHALGLVGRNCEYLEQHLARVGADEQTRQAVNDISAAAARLDRTMNEVMTLLDFLRAEEPPQLSPLDLCQMLQQIAAQADMVQEQLNVELTLDYGGLTSCRVMADCSDAELLCLHLLSNALRASAPGGKIVLRLCRAEDAWRLTVTDHGCGLPGPANWQENRRRFLGGAGAGLKICRAVCRRAGWGFALEAGSGGGAEAVVTLPMEPETAASGDTIALHAAGEVLPSRLRWQLERELHLLAGNA